MSRRLPTPIIRSLAMGAFVAVLAPAAPAAASPFWTGWHVADRPVIYRPIVTPRTYFFAPAGTAEMRPAPRHRHHRNGRHHPLPH